MTFDQAADIVTTLHSIRMSLLFIETATTFLAILYALRDSRR